MKYLVLEKQVETGCDYSIGCGMTWKFVELDEKDPEIAAIQIAQKMAYPSGMECLPGEDFEDIEFGFDPDNDRALAELWVIPADSVVVFVFEMRKLYQARRKESEDEKEKVTELEKEIVVTDGLLEDRQRVLDAIPACPRHGSCVPHAIEWVKKVQELGDAMAKDYKRVTWEQIDPCDPSFEGMAEDDVAPDTVKAWEEYREEHEE